MFDFEKKGLSSHSDLVWVCIFGALGGFLFWAFWTFCILHGGDFCKPGGLADVAGSTDPGISTWLSLPLSVLLGAGSGAVFVFLIASTDRTDKARLLTLAFLSGISWKPVLIYSEIAMNAADAQKKNTLLTVEVKEVQSSLEKIKDQVSGINPPQPSSRDVNNQTEEGMASNETSQEEPIEFITNLIELTTNLTEALVFPHANKEYSLLELPTSFEELEPLQLGEQKSSSSNQWYRLSINDEQKVTIEITAENADDDLIARLYRYDESEILEPVDFDDDSGKKNNPKLEVNLPGGEYLLNVAHFVEEDRPLNFSVAYNPTKSVQGSPADDGSQ